MTLVQEFLRSGNTLADLAARFAVKAIPGVTYPNLVTLKYSQIESPMAEPLVRECRGIVLDRDDDWRCVARGFDKFFNYGEPLAADIDWTTATVQEKLDGSLCLVYWYDGGHRVATTGHPEAGGPVGSCVGTFADLFWRAVEECAESGVFCLTRGARAPWPGPKATALFELCAPENRVVVPHSSRRVVALGARDVETGEERRAPEGRVAGIEGVRSFPLTSMPDVLATFDALDPLAQEGYVIVDGAFRRVKVKHPGYVALHHLRYATSTRSLLDVARRGETLELLAAFPELAAELDDIRARLDGYAERVAADYAPLAGIEDRKTFALAATQTTCPGALFALRDGKVSSVREYLRGVQIGGLLRSLGLRDAEDARGV
jgi:hypothetical protein